MRYLLIALLLSGCTATTGPSKINEDLDDLNKEVDKLARSIRELSCSLELNQVPMPELQKKICNYLRRPDNCAKPTDEEIRRAISWIVEDCARRKQP